MDVQLSEIELLILKRNTLTTCTIGVSTDVPSGVLFPRLQVNISVLLVGENSFPVTASVTVSQRAAPGAGGAALPADLVMDEALFWDAGEYCSVKALNVLLPDKVRSSGTTPAILHHYAGRCILFCEAP